MEKGMATTLVSRADAQRHILPSASCYDFKEHNPGGKSLIAFFSAQPVKLKLMYHVQI